MHLFAEVCRAFSSVQRSAALTAPNKQRSPTAPKRVSSSSSLAEKGKFFTTSTLSLRATALEAAALPPAAAAASSLLTSAPAEGLMQWLWLECPLQLARQGALRALKGTAALKHSNRIHVSSVLSSPARPASPAQPSTPASPSARLVSAITCVSPSAMRTARSPASRSSSSDLLTPVGRMEQWSRCVSQSGGGK